MTERWLSIVGIGEDGLEGLTPRGRMLTQGAWRHLGLDMPVPTGQATLFDV